MNANDLRALLARWADEMAQKRDWLIELDSVVGDSDLGLTMSDGLPAPPATQPTHAFLRTWASCAHQARQGHGQRRALHHGHADGQRPDELRARS